MARRILPTSQSKFSHAKLLGRNNDYHVSSRAPPLSRVTVAYDLTRRAATSSTDVLHIEASRGTMLHASDGSDTRPSIRVNGPSDSGRILSCGIAATAARPDELENIAGFTENQQDNSTARCTCRLLAMNQLRTNVPALDCSLKASSTSFAAPRLCSESTRPPAFAQRRRMPLKIACCCESVERCRLEPSKPTSPTNAVRLSKASKSTSSLYRVLTSSGWSPSAVLMQLSPGASAAVCANALGTVVTDSTWMFWVTQRATT